MTFSIGRRTVLRAAIAVCALSATATAAFADDRGTADDAKALVERAAVYYKQKGRDAAIEAFNNPSGEFRNKDLYLFGYTPEGTRIVHGAFKHLIGRDIKGDRDPEGKYYAKEMLETALQKGSGWVDYKYVNPATKKIEQKSSYVMKVGDVILGSGFYK
jgi:cytochrome c